MKYFTNSRRLCAALLLTLLALLATLPAQAEYATIDGIRYYLSSYSNTASVTNGVDYIGDIVIPDEVTYCNKSYSVTSIGDCAFWDCSSLTSIGLPNSVTSIGWNAFYGCTGLTSIVIPNSVTSIDKSTFNGCVNLANITVSPENEKYCSIDGVVYSKDKSQIIVCPAGKKGSFIIPNSVTSIGESAFSGCSGLTSIKISHSVTSISNGAFSGCTGLTSIEIPNSVTAIGRNAFAGCVGLTSIEIPNTVTSIDYDAFYGCTGLTSIVIPSSVTDITSNAFTGCANLTNISVSPENKLYCSIDGVIYSKDKSQIIICPPGKKGSFIIPNSVISISNYAFAGCTGLTSIEIPKSTTAIGMHAFHYCTSLTSINIPNSVTSIGDYAFDGCDLHPLKIMSARPQIYFSDKTFSYLNSSSDIVCSIFNYKRMKSLWSYNLYCYDSHFAGIKDLKECIAGVSFDVNTDNPYYEAGNASPVLSAEVTYGSSIVGSLDNLSFETANIIKGLGKNKNYNLHIYAATSGDKLEVYNKQFSTEPSITFDYTSTQTTIKIKSIEATLDENFSTPRIEYETSSGGKKVYNGGDITIKNLRPNKGYRVYAYYGSDNIYEIVKTKDISVSAQNLQTGPTTFNLEGSYNLGDAKLDKVEWLKDGEVVSTSQNFTSTGLSPATEYNMVFRVTTVSKSGETYSKDYSKSFTTSSLDLEILNPKNVSAKKSIVAAKTNISDEETNVGFQWKKYDAPASLPYSEAYTAICDGQIEGVINNLQPTYYNVRAFYKDANGKYYYSDLTTFDPTDFSFFQPTVHTYPAAVSPKGVQLKGYALEGTDDIISQGFEYWVSGAAKSERLNVAAASNINTVVAKGQRMTAELTNLKEGTTYLYRAFVETAAGRIYGDELSFTTPGLGAVDGIEADDPEVTVVAYYDLSGRRYAVPQHGLNIVVYSDGTTKKIFFKH